jgi:hypothetical protein
MIMFGMQDQRQFIDAFSQENSALLEDGHGRAICSCGLPEGCHSQNRFEPF